MVLTLCFVLCADIGTDRNFYLTQPDLTVILYPWWRVFTARYARKPYTYTYYVSSLNS